MKFPPEYFEDDVRDGFYVPGMMKRAWAAQMEVFQTLRTYCEENDITIYAAYGTLLGAARHHGFIPWDDDMDVWMTRKDFEKFRVVSNMLPDGLEFLSGRYGEDKLFDQPFGRIINTRDFDLRDEFLDKYHGFPLPAGIDIFVLDKIASDEADEEIRYQQTRYIYRTIQLLADKKNGTLILEDELDQGLDTIEMWLGKPLNREGNLFQQLMLILEGLYALYEEDDGREFTAMHDWMQWHSYKLPISDFSQTTELPFESMTVPVPVGYKDVLTRIWGKNYMVPYQGTTHEYPFYLKLEEGLRKKNIREEFRFYYDKDVLKRNSSAERKKTTRDLLKIFGQSADMTIRALQTGNAVEVKQALEQTQTIAGKFYEYLNLYFSDAVDTQKRIEEYHENIFRFYQILFNPDDMASDENSADALFYQLLNAPKEIARSCEHEVLQPIEVVFLPFKLEGWKNMEPLYHYFATLTNVRTYVVPIPYFRKEANFSFDETDRVDETEKIREVVNIADPQEINLGIHTPDIIITQNPYDQYGIGFSVDVNYYSEVLQKYSKCVVYVPWFRTDEIIPAHGAAYAAADAYIKQPGVMRADMVLVPSYNMRHVYIDKLTEFAGSDTWKRWEKTVQVANCEKDYQKLFSSLTAAGKQ